MASKTLIDLRGVSRSYQQGGATVRALADVDLQIDAGEFVALVGPSGSGKTSLLNLMGALDTPDAGQVLIGDDDLGRLKRAQRAALRLHKLGFVFQHYSLIPVLSALENVEYVLVLQGVGAAERRRRATEALEAVGLSALLHRRPDQLSGGQQQRVAVARAIVGKPLLVLADEPTANLDSETGAWLLALMRGLHDRTGTTFVFATHDPAVVKQAHRVVRLKDGKVMEDTQHAVPETRRA
ncbi:MAG TPA: ABC transporter ATP-binding protein [Albitalea sp.]|nr:ABC transporter ATP-binding protein [Albitalea sp.]